MSTTTGQATPGAITLDSMRADIARIMHEDPDEIGDEDSLIDLGLDSIRAMALLTRWREQGADIAFSDLAEIPTLAHWWAQVEAAQQRRVPQGQ